MDNKIKTGVIITDQKDKILLLKEKIEKNDKALWNIVKGSYGDYGDENIFDCARRECLEEVSVNIEIKGFQGCYVSQKKHSNYIMIIFTAKIKNGEPRIQKIDQQKKTNEDIRDIQWFEKNDILKMEKGEFISQRIYSIIRDWAQNSKTPLIKQI